MARIYSRKKGKASSHKPPIKVVPRWVKYKKEDVENLVITLTKERYPSAVIGTIIRDKYGISDVKILTGKTITQIMRANKLYPEMPEDLVNLLRKAVNLREHMTKFKKDKSSKRGLEQVESKIRRLGKYYSKRDIIEKDWKYDPEKAKLIVQQK